MQIFIVDFFTFYDIYFETYLIRNQIFPYYIFIYYILIIAQKLH